MQEKLFILPAREPTEPGHTSTHNLPAQLTPLIGRKQEVVASSTLLRRPEVRLLTLTGTGGIGKTSLALRIATDLLDDFPDGVCLVLLAPISDPDLVIPTIAQTLAIKEVAVQSPLASLKAHLEDKHLLLLLDNFEQVVVAAPVLTDLLESCPSLKLLVTSREVLRIRGEHEYPVPSLTIPELQQPASIEGIAQYAASTDTIRTIITSTSEVSDHLSRLPNHTRSRGAASCGTGTDRHSYSRAPRHQFAHRQHSLNLNL